MTHKIWLNNHYNKFNFYWWNFLSPNLYFRCEKHVMKFFRRFLLNITCLLLLNIKKPQYVTSLDSVMVYDIYKEVTNCDMFGSFCCTTEYFCFRRNSLVIVNFYVIFKILIYWLFEIFLTLVMISNTYKCNSALYITIRISPTRKKKW